MTHVSRYTAPARMWRYLLIWLGCAAGIAAALWLRFDLIENGAVAHACFAGAESFDCTARAAALASLRGQRIAIAAGAAALLALAWQHPASAWLAVTIGGIALVLYSAEAGAAALLIGVLRLLRWQLGALARPRHQQRRGEQHIADRP